MSDVLRGESLVKDVEETGARPSAGPALSKKVQSLRISEVHTPTRGSAGFAWFLCFLMACSTGYFAWRVYGQTETAAATSGMVPSQASAPAGERESFGEPAKTGNVVHSSKGYIIPTHQILVSPKVNGMVQYLRIHKAGESAEAGLPLEEGLYVHKGDILAVLESTDYESDVARCKAILASAEQKLEMERKNVPQEIERATAELNEAVTQRDYAKNVLDRNTSLAKSGSVSPIELEKSQSDYTAAKHRVARLERALEIIRGPRAERIRVAEAEVSSARADLVKAEWRLDNCTIVAPITGTILRKNVEEGNIVNPVAFNGSYSVCDMADLSNLEVDLSIQERDIARIFKDQRCIIKSEAYPERPYEGYVSRLMPIADRAKGAVSVRVKILIPPGEEGVYLKPEMGALVTFYAAGEKPQAVKSASQDQPHLNEQDR